MANCMQVDSLSKSFGDKRLFENLSFTINDREKVALIAKNGTGKTTFLNIIAGKESPDTGEIIFRNDIKVGYLPQLPTFAPTLTVIEACLQSENEVIAAIRQYEKALLHPHDEKAMNQAFAQMELYQAWDYETRIKQILSQLKITDFDKKIATLSGGMLKKVALANALIVEPDLLILDEPTNHLDLDIIEWLENYLKNSTFALLMVTHDRYFLDRVCTQIIEIDNQQLYTYQGNYTYYIEKRDERIANALSEQASAANIYKRELEWMRSTPQARTSKSKGRIDRFYEWEKKAKQPTQSKNIQLSVDATYIGSKIFEAHSVSKSFGKTKILDDFSYTFSRYEKLGIIGGNGTGKTTFLKLILGKIALDSGTIEVGETVRFGYYSQEGLTFDEQMKVIDAVSDIAEVIDIGNGQKLSASQFLHHFLFPYDVQHNYIYKLSGGEKRRLHLCTVLMQNPNFLILDEPTNDLDILTLNVLEEYLIGFKGCVMMVSHDRYFMDKVVDHLFVFNGDGDVQDFPGNYEQYRAWRDEQEKERMEEEKKQREKEEKKQDVLSTPQDRPRKLTFKEKRELEMLDEEIPLLEKQKSDIEAQLSGEVLDHELITELSQQHTLLVEQLDEKTMRWLELSDI